MVLPKEKGLEREAVSWYTKMYPRTQAPDWPSARPVEIIQVCCAPYRKKIHHELPHMPPLVEMQQGAVMRALSRSFRCAARRTERNTPRAAAYVSPS